MHADLTEDMEVSLLEIPGPFVGRCHSSMGCHEENKMPVDALRPLEHSSRPARANGPPRQCDQAGYCWDYC